MSSARLLKSLLKRKFKWKFILIVGKYWNTDAKLFMTPFKTVVQCQIVNSLKHSQ